MSADDAMSGETIEQWTAHDHRCRVDVVTTEDHRHYTGLVLTALNPHDAAIPVIVHGDLSVALPAGDKWWVGFDCDQRGDACLIDYVVHMQENHHYRFLWSLPDVRAEVTRLAEQISSIEDTTPHFR